MTTINKALPFALLMGLATASFADTSNTNNIEAEPYTQLCKAALKSEEVFLETARKLNIGKAERDRLVCNELSVEEFASSYRLTEQNTIATVQ